MANSEKKIKALKKALKRIEADLDKLSTKLAKDRKSPAKKKQPKKKKAKTKKPGKPSSSKQETAAASTID